MNLVESTSTGKIVAMFLHGKPANTVRAYSKDLEGFLDVVGVELEEVTLAHFQRYQDSLAHLAPSTQARKTASVKSLLTFAHKAGFLRFNVGTAVTSPSVPNTISERYLTESEVLRMLDKAGSGRDRLVVYMLYSTGVRVSELAGLRWKHLSDGVLTIHGKGAKTRHLLLAESLKQQLEAHRGLVPVGLEEPIFVSQKGSPLSVERIHRIVARLGLEATGKEGVSPHWLRHAHASHSLDRSAPIHLVQAQLGHSSLTTTSKYTHSRPSETSAKYLVV